jgi:hypothetical protein
LYLNLRLSPPAPALPDAASESYRDSNVGGKAVNAALEPAYADYVKRHRGQLHGWNTTTIPREHRSCFVGTRSVPEPTAFIRRLRDQGMLTLDSAVSDGTLAAVHAAIVDVARTAYFEMPRRGMSAAIRQDVMQKSDEAFALVLNAPRLKKSRYCGMNSTDLYCAYDAANDRRMKCLMGVQGLTLSSQMLDVFSHPTFARALVEAHPRLKAFCGMEHIYYGRERCSLRAPGATELPPHTDDPFNDGKYE